jgi:hypothetical protein
MLVELTPTEKFVKLLADAVGGLTVEQRVALEDAFNDAVEHRLEEDRKVRERQDY